MRYCGECKVNVRTETENCPLCGEQLEPADGDASERSFPPYRKLRRKVDVISIVFGSVTLAAIICCAVLNALFYDGLVWAVMAIGLLLYAWLVTQFTILMRVSVGAKLLAHSVAAPLLLLIVDLFGSPGQYALSWSLSWACPALGIGFTVTAMVLGIIRKNSHKNFAIYVLSIALTGLIYPILAFCLAERFDLMIWPDIASAAASLSVLAGMFIFLDGKTKTEFKKRFHFH